MVSQQPQSRGGAAPGMAGQAGGASHQGSGGGGQQAGATAQDVVQQTQEKVGQVADQAKEQAGQVVDQAKQQATSQLSSQKDRAADSLGTVADALRQTGKHLHENDQHGLEHYANKAAERVEQVSGQLREKDVQEIVRDVERYARQQPAIVLGGAFVLGLLGARFLKSTAQREDNGGPSDYRDRGNQSGGYRPGYYARAYGGRYGGGATPGGYGATTSPATGATTGPYSGQHTGGAPTDRPGAGGTGTGERSWSVRGTEAR